MSATYFGVIIGSPQQDGSYATQMVPGDTIALPPADIHLSINSPLKNGQIATSSAIVSCAYQIRDFYSNNQINAVDLGLAIYPGCSVTTRRRNGLWSVTALAWYPSRTAADLTMSGNPTFINGATATSAALVSAINTFITYLKSGGPNFIDG